MPKENAAPRHLVQTAEKKVLKFVYSLAERMFGESGSQRFLEGSFELGLCRC